MSETFRNDAVPEALVIEVGKATPERAKELETALKTIHGREVEPCPPLEDDQGTRENMKRFSLFGFEGLSNIRYDVLGAPVERGNAILLRTVPLDGEPSIDALEIGQSSWCRSATEDVSKQGTAKKNKGRTPSADRFVVERVV